MAGSPDQTEQRAVDRMTAGVFAVNRDLVLTFHNSAAARIAGRDGERLIGRGLRELFPHIIGSQFEDALGRALADQEIREFEDFSPFAGRWLWRRLYPDEDGVTCIFGEFAMPRISEVELRASLTRAQESERRYRGLLDGMAEGVAETTLAGEFLAVNQSLAAMLGYDSPEDLITTVANAKNLYVNQEERTTQVARVARESLPVGDVELLRKDGTHIWVRAHGSPRRNPSGEITSVQAIVEDLTERRYSERELREVTERIEERERALLAESVHDDPIQLIVAAILRIDTLQNLLSPPHAETVEQIVGLLEHAVERLRQLVTSLTPPDLTGGLGEALLQSAEGIFVGTTTRIDIVGPRHVPLTPVVKTDCYRIVREALINARKHANAQHLTIGLTTGTDSVEIWVTDDGSGAKAFNAGPGHLGIGLMRARAKLLRGHLLVDSSPSSGTTVRLVVPREPESTSANDPAPVSR